MDIPKSYEALAADLASEKILRKTLLGQKEAYMMLADQCKVDLDEAMARNSALERKNANQCETIREYQDIEAALLEELELQKNHFKIQLQGAKDADMLQQRLTVAERRAGDLERLIDSGAARDVLSERRRQIMEEHRLPIDDDDYTLGQLAWAASGYAAGSTTSHQAGGTLQPTNWPWAPRWWKPGAPRQMLIKSGALILAEIERIDRAALKPAAEGEGS